MTLNDEYPLAVNCLEKNILIRHETYAAWKYSFNLPLCLQKVQNIIKIIYAVKEDVQKLGH